jgi:FkbM family methyltransferase
LASPQASPREIDFNEVVNMKKIFKAALGNLGYQIQGTRCIPQHLLNASLLRDIELDDVICRHMFETTQSLTFIQVGAFDGITKDPIRPYIDRCGWQGILVEPQPRAAEKLRILYQNNNRVSVVEAALDRQRGQRSLYVVEGPSAPDWAGGLASFDLKNILKHADLIPGLEGMVKEILVDSLTFEDVIKQLPTENIDLLQIDTEGADAYILSLFPFEKIKPAIVHWEIKHLSKSEREACFEPLVALGYRLASSGTEDMLAVLM